jgi:predicted CopG family antitoxin
MGTADKQIRVSDEVKRMLDRRRRKGESYNDTLERLLGDGPEASFYDGFGVLSDDEAETVREERENAREKRRRRRRRLEDSSA